MATKKDIGEQAKWQKDFHLLSAVVQDSNDAITVQDFEGKISLWNLAAERLYGYSRAEALKMNISQIIPEDRRAEMRSLTEKLRKGDNIQSFETRRIAKDGRILDVWLTITTLNNQAGKPVAITTTERDITERKHLEREMLEIPMREREQIGREMHDSMGQILTGIAVKSKGLELKLKSKSLDGSYDAAEICQLANKLIAQTRHIAKMLHPVNLEAGGLVSALRALASNTKRLLKVSCRFKCKGPVSIQDPATAKHLYRIVQEAVNNAVKHGKARNIRIELASGKDTAVLTVKNDGRGFPRVQKRKGGLGLKIMEYRARAIGGSLDIRRAPRSGTILSCSFPNESGNFHEETDYGAEEAATCSLRR